MKTLALVLLLLVPVATVAQDPSPAAAREITQLFAALQSSNCEFYRNGSWYSADKAAKHLHRKYDYLLARGQVTTAESFIELAATKSSLSGRPYLVRCAEAHPVTSKSWFTETLKALRGRSASANNTLAPKPRRGPLESGTRPSLVSPEITMTSGAKVKGPASCFPSIEETYGQPVAHWFNALDALGRKKHMEQVAHLKSEHRMGHGHANALVAYHLAQSKA